jgi:serine/threonine-protein kinase
VSEPSISDIKAASVPADDLLDAGLAIAFGPGSVAPNSSTDSRKEPHSHPPKTPRVHLREPEEDAAAPLIRPGSQEMPSPIEPGETVGRYQLLGEISRGGMGAVLKGRDVDLGRDIAIKVLLEAHRDRAELAQRFIEEAQIAGQLQHPGIAPIYELGVFPDRRPYFTMKLVKGQTLAASLAARKNLADDRSKLLGVFEQVCQTLAYAHSRGVIHRDLKPSNVMVGAFGEVQVMDWGLAKILRSGGVADEAMARQCQKRGLADPGNEAEANVSASEVGDADASYLHFGSRTQAGSMLGTPAYMAPEQAGGVVDLIDERTDVFGLGAILCEILTGQPPFTGAAGEIRHKAKIAEMDEAYTRLGECGADKELIALARNCLAPQPWDRPRHAGEVASALIHYERSSAQRLRQAELDRTAAEARADSERKRRHVTLALGSLVVLLVLAGTTGTALWWKHQAALASERLALATEAEKALGDAMKDEAAGRWADARATLAQAVGRLGNTGPDSLRERLHLALADATMVAEFDDIGLRLSKGSRSFDENATLADRLYAEAFEKYGIGLASAELSQGVTRVRDSAIRETLIGFLHDWLYWAPDSNRAKVRALLEGADDNEWRRSLREALAAKDSGKLKALTDQPEATRQPAIVVCNLADALSRLSAGADGVKLLRNVQRRQPNDFWINCLLARFLLKTRPKEAVGYARAAIALRPTSGLAHMSLAQAFLSEGDDEEAIAAFREAILRDPDVPTIHTEIVPLMASKGRLSEAPAIWEKILADDPRNHNAWFGYAELCLFLGDKEAYHRACKALMERFADTTEPLVAERVSRSCLLAPDSEEQLQVGLTLARRAASSGVDWLRPFYLLSQGLGEYRQNRPEKAIPLLQESAATIPYSTARLALSMAQFRCGLREEARKNLEAAVHVTTWDTKNNVFVDDLVAHILRREAESMLGPVSP